MKISYTMVDSPQFYNTHVNFCRQLTTAQFFDNYRIGFDEKMNPFSQKKSYGYFNPFNRLFFSVNPISYNEKLNLITNVNKLIQENLTGIISDENSQDPKRCNLAAIGVNIDILKTKFLQGSNKLESDILTPIFNEVQMSLTLGKQIQVFLASVPTNQGFKKIEMEHFVSLLQSNELSKYNFIILKDLSIYAIEKKNQQWKSANLEVAHIAIAQQIRELFTARGFQAFLKDEKKCNLLKICNGINTIQKELVNGVDPAAIPIISKHILKTTNYLSELHNQIQAAKPTLIGRACSLVGSPIKYLLTQTGTMAYNFLYYFAQGVNR